VRGLTAQQQKVLAFIRQSLRDRGLTPTLREICAHIGASSTAAAADHVRKLEGKGYLKRLRYRGRGLVLLKEPTPATDPRERIAQLREQIAALEEELAALLTEDERTG
jgi:repressor LexA